MGLFDRTRQPLLWTFLLAAGCLYAQSVPQQWILIGGQDSSSNAYAARISPSGAVTVFSLGLTNPSEINSVSINPSGYGLLGGISNGGADPAYAALILPSGTVNQLPFTPDGAIYSVAINGANQGLIGGTYVMNPYAAIVSPYSLATQVPLPNASAVSSMQSVAINASGYGLVGGYDLSSAYAATISPTGKTVQVSGLNATDILGVAINSLRQGLVGGQNVDAPYAAYVSSSGNASTITLPGSSTGMITSVAFNDSGYGLVGGQNNANPYVALLSPAILPIQVNLGVADGQINSVAINDFGYGLAGGIYNDDLAYAAFISPTGKAKNINLSSLPASSSINSVAINDYGQGLIGGYSGASAYAAIVSSSGVVVPLNISLPNGEINSVSLAMLLQIPTSSLNGNNLIFADYINQFAPENAFYFIPATLDGTLASALESAAPTRNGISLFTALNNSFYLTTDLSTHLCAQRFSSHRKEKLPPPKSSIFSQTEEMRTEEMGSEDELLTSFSILSKGKKEEKCDPCKNEDPPYAIWLDVIGALAYQKSQRQTPGFDPVTGGGILAFDGRTSEQTRMGFGLSYLYTHVHEKKGAGHSNINQESLFIYGSWTGKNFYIDLAAWGGLVQIDQTRNIEMTGFSFKSSSHPNGWQALPHLEVGFNTNLSKPSQDTGFVLNPFAMCDWSNGWQNSYKENGDGPFNIRQRYRYASLLRSEAGLRMYTTLFFKCWNLTIQEKGSYVNLQVFHPGKVNGYIVGFPGSFTVQTLTAAQNLGVGQFALIFDPVKRFFPKIMTFYQGEFGSKYQSHQVTLEISSTF